jgi:hypothetical protein
MAVPGNKIESFQKQAVIMKLPVWVIGNVMEGSGVHVI